MMNCPKCNNALPDDSKFCQYCGANMDTTRVATPIPPEPNHLNPPPSVKSPRPQYCKRCGNIIDSQTKVCSGCGKKYINWAKILNIKIIVPAILSVLLALSLFSNIMQAIEVNEYQELIREKEDLISSLIDAGFEDWSNLQFYEEYVVFVSDDGTNRYHKYGCSKFDDAYFWAFNVDAAIDKGYTPCPHCID